MSVVDFFIGRHIRMFRLSSGLSQAELARELGLAPQQIERFENGTLRVSALQLLQIAQILNVPVASFFEDDPALPAPDAHSRQITVLSLFNTLSDPQQIALLNMTEAMAAARAPLPASGPGAALPPLSETKGG